MAETIQSSAEGASELGAHIQGFFIGLDNCLIKKLGYAAEVDASKVHDSLSEGITEAQQAWNELINSDADSLMGVVSQIEALDDATAQQFTEIGWLAS